MAELNALKPGNVSRYADGHGMTAHDFILSAALVTPVLCDHRLTMGQRILDSVKITRAKVGTNTNLGMLLLFAPIISALEKFPQSPIGALQNNIRLILSSLSNYESGLVFQAISQANPGGLGDTAQYDVRSQPDCTLLEAMSAAKERDAIARQFANGYHDIFSSGLSSIKKFTALWNSVEWASVACYLTFLSDIPDSHIMRKFGMDAAVRVQKKSAGIAARFKNNDNPENALEALLEFDKDLKDHNINPGTSADLTAASILIYKLTDDDIGAKI